jgi:hypothetical protein
VLHFSPRLYEVSRERKQPQKKFDRIPALAVADSQRFFSPWTVRLAGSQSANHFKNLDHSAFVRDDRQAFAIRRTIGVRVAFEDSVCTSSVPPSFAFNMSLSQYAIRVWVVGPVGTQPLAPVR